MRPGDRAQLIRNYAYCLRKTGDKKQARQMETEAARISPVARADAGRKTLVDVSQLARKQ